MFFKLKIIFQLFSIFPIQLILKLYHIIKGLLEMTDEITTIFPYLVCCHTKFYIELLNHMQTLLQWKLRPNKHYCMLFSLFCTSFIILDTLHTVFQVQIIQLKVNKMSTITNGYYFSYSVVGNYSRLIFRLQILLSDTEYSCKIAVMCCLIA